jgi:hypothetical protein
MVNYYRNTGNERYDNYPQMKTCDPTDRKNIAAYLGNLLKSNKAPTEERILQEFTRLLYKCPGVPQRRPEVLLNQLFRVFNIRRNAHGPEGAQADNQPYYLTGDFMQHADVTDVVFKDADKTVLSGSFGPDMAVLYLPRVTDDRKEMATVETSGLIEQVSHAGGVTQRYRLLAVIVHTHDSHYVVQYPAGRDSWYEYDNGRYTPLGSYQDVMAQPRNPNNSGVLFFYTKRSSGSMTGNMSGGKTGSNPSRSKTSRGYGLPPQEAESRAGESSAGGSKTTTGGSKTTTGGRITKGLTARRTRDATGHAE